MQIYRKYIIINNKKKLKILIFTFLIKKNLFYFNKISIYLYYKHYLYIKAPFGVIIKIKFNLMKNKDTFINEAKTIHGDKYDYSKVEYINSKTKVCIICPIHGEFWQTPQHHVLRQQGCPKCSGRYKTTEQFIEEAKTIHGDKYNYNNTVYNGSHSKLKIICPIHGEFEQIAKDHLNGQGCPKCKCKRIWDTRGRITTESFVKKYFEKFPDKLGNYDFSKADYVKNSQKITVICNEHGEFLITPNALLAGECCSKCSKVYRPTTEEFIERAKTVHGNKYDYNKVEYINSKTKICIICPEHGEFWQIPYSHLNGQGCPKCVMSHMENKIKEFLINLQIKYEYETNINGLLKRQSVDFYLPDYNIALECQGGQHFYGGFNRNNIQKANEIHRKVLYRDIIKYKKLKLNNINILYFSDINDLPDDIFTNNKYKNIYNEDNFFTELNKLAQKINGERYCSPLIKHD